MEKSYIHGKICMLNKKNLHKSYFEITDYIAKNKKCEDTLNLFTQQLFKLEEYEKISKLNINEQVSSVTSKNIDLINYVVHSNIRCDKIWENINFFENMKDSVFDSKNIEIYKFLFNIARCYSHLKLYNKAIEIYQKYNIIRMQVVFDYMNNNQFDKALKISFKILKNATLKEEVHLYFLLYSIYLKQNNLKKAHKYLYLGELKFRLIAENECKITRSFILGKYYYEINNVKSYRYFRKALFEYDCKLYYDKKSRLEAFNFIKNKKFFSKKELEEVKLLKN